MKHQYQLNAPLLASNIVLHWIHLPLCGQLTSIQEIQYMNAFGGICVSLPLDYRLPFSLIFGPFLQRQISSPQVMECLNQLPSIPSLLYPTYENDIFLELDGVQFLGVPTTPFSFSKGPWLACSEAHLDSSLVLLLPSYEVQHSVLLDDPKKAIFSCFPSTGKFSVNVKWYQNVATHQQAFCFPICDSRVFFHILTYPLSSLNFPPTLSSPVPSSLFHSHVSERTFPSLPTVHAMEPFFSPTFNESLPSSLNPFSSPIELQLEFLNPSMPTTPCLPSTPFSTSPFVNLIDLVLELTYTTTPPFPNFYRRLPELRPQFFSCLSSLISTNAQLSEKFKIQLPLFFKNTTSMNWSSQEHSYLESHVCDSSEQQHQWMIQSWIRACCLQCVFYFEDLLIQPDQVEHHTTQLQFLLSRLELLCSQHHQRLMLDHHWQVDVKSWFEQVMVYHYYSSFPTLIHDLYVQLGGEIESYKAHTVHPFSPLPTRKKSAKLPTTPSFHRSFPVKTHPTQKGSSSGPGSTRKSRLMQRLRGAREIVIKDQGSNKRELKEEEEEDEEDDDDDEGEEEDNEEKDQRKEREKRNFSDMHFNFEKNKRKKEKLQMVPNVSIRRRKNDFLGIDEAEEKVKVKVKDKDQEEEEEEEESFWAAESPTKRISKKKEIKKALFGALVFGARLRGQPELTLSKEIELDVSEERPEPWVVKSSGSSFQDRFQSFVAKYSLGLSSSSQES
ncbi:hypothetical protein HMI55_006432 [Coelomomyces lativittatus]|nr:hypothetical protein HMI55_006432 [Coelomomyces lativittatus]